MFFWVLNLENLYFFGTGLKRLVFYIFNRIFGVQIELLGASLNKVRDCHHILFNFCQMNRVLIQYFLGFCFSESTFWVLCQWKIIFWVIWKYTADPCL